MATQQLATIIFLCGHLALVGAGLAFIFHRPMGLRVALLALVLIVVATVLPELPHQLSVTNPFSAVTLFMSLLGILCLVLGFNRTGLSLLTPAALRWLVWPIVAPLLEAWLASQPRAVALLLWPGSALLLGIWLLQRALARVFGNEAAGHVAGTLLIRILDGIFQFVTWPFRLLGRLFNR